MAGRNQSRSILIVVVALLVALAAAAGAYYVIQQTGGGPAGNKCGPHHRRCPKATATMIAVVVTPTPPITPATDTPVPAPTVAPTPAGTPVAVISGWLHTNGATILDNQNHIVVFHGINHTGMEVGTGQPATSQPGGYRPPTTKEYDDIAAWGFNVVRLPISWANLEPQPPVAGAGGTLQHQYNQPYLTALDDVINEFGQRHVAVILVMHQWNWSPAFSGVTDSGNTAPGNGLPAWLYPNSSETMQQAKLDFFSDKNRVQEGFVAAWTMVARRYANNPTVVGADLFNEPSQGVRLTTAQYQLATFYMKVGPAIRAVNPNITLIYQDADTSDGRALHGPLSLLNSIYSVHFYPKVGFNNDPQGGEPWLNAYYERSVRWGVPFWVGEFGKIGHTDYTTQMPPFITYLEQRRISWAYWAYSGSAAEIRQATVNPNEKALLNLLQAAIKMQPPPAQ